MALLFWRVVGFSVLSMCLSPAATACLPLLQERVSDTVGNEAAVPFSIGERLVYSVKWYPPWFLFFLPTMEAGEAELQLIGETEYKGAKALKISFKARSSGIFVRLSGIKVDDEFIFLAEPATYCALSASKKVREGKHRHQIDVEYIRETHQLHFRELDESVRPPKIKKDEYKGNIPDCVKDPFSALYLLRMSELNAKYAQTLLIGNDDMIKEVRSQVEKRETIETPIGKFPAWRINTISLLGGLFKEGGQFRIWISADRRRLPLQFEARVRLGRAIGKLKEIR